MITCLATRRQKVDLIKQALKADEQPAAGG